MKGWVLRFLLFFFGLLVLAGLAQAATWVEGRVSRVTDGDSIWLQASAQELVPEDWLKNGRLQLRIKDIDAPEFCQAGGPQATAALRQRLQGQQVRVALLHRDKYQRWLARVYVPNWPKDGDVGAWMVAQGHAWDYQYPSLKPGRYAPLQAQAKAQGLGLWADAGAVHPQQFRRTHGPCFVMPQPSAVPSGKAVGGKRP